MPGGIGCDDIDSIVSGSIGGTKSLFFWYSSIICIAALTQGGTSSSSTLVNASGTVTADASSGGFKAASIVMDDATLHQLFRRLDPVTVSSLEFDVGSLVSMISNHLFPMSGMELLF